MGWSAVPRVNVVIPLRDTDAVLPECQRGLEAQTYRGFDVQVEQSARSAGANRNTGATKSSSEFLLFLDADVELEAGFLQAMVDALDAHPEASYAYCSYERRGALTGTVDAKPFNPDELRRENYISTMSLIRRAAFPGFNEELQRLQDWDLWLRMLDRGHTGVFVEGTGFVAYYKPGDLSTADNWDESVRAVERSVAAAKHVDIVIPAWNKSDYTIRCLESIAEHTTAYRVLLIDNGSRSEEQQAVAKALRQMPHRVIANDTNLGFVKATNQGIATSQSDVVLLNNDTVVPPGWLDELRTGAWSGYSIVGPLAQAGVPSWQAADNVASRFGAVPRAGYIEVGHMVAFFCALITRACIADVGYLSEAYGIGFGDDDDFCFRARQRGHRIGLATNVVVQHDHRTTFKELVPNYEELQERNLALFHERSRQGW